MAICLAAQVLSGCLARPPNHSDVLEKSLPKGTCIPASWNYSGGGNAAVSDNWLESFHDPGLDAVVEEAIKNNMDLIIRQGPRICFQSFSYKPTRSPLKPN